MSIPRVLFRLLLGRRTPITSGSVKVPGIERPVTIRRDRYGIPYIEAESDEDAWHAVGFCQGQDRAFRLEVLLRLARGTLSEFVGPRGLAVDRLSRRIGFLRSAGPQLEALAPDIHAMLDAFARGVTAGLTKGSKRKAHEFKLLRSKPTPWSAVDVVAVGKLQSFVMSSNWDIELARLYIQREDGPEALEAVDPPYPSWQPVSLPPAAEAGQAAGRLADDLRLLAETAGLRGASNAWAIAPERTATGRPLLANDPHLQPLIPPHWYLASVRTPEWAVAGATFVGAPSFPIGHNDVAAWGLTLGLADNTDLFIEELAADGRSVREGDQFVECEVRREVIRYKGRGQLVEDVVITPRGPIVGPALGDELGSISIRALWLDPLPMKGLLVAHRARSFEEFRRSFEEWPSMSLSMVYADTSGSIGWQLAGQVPRRRKGWGTVPLPGWDQEVGWHEAPVAFDEMPHVSDPPSGFVATANNQPTPDGEGPFLGYDWIDGYRYARILEGLDARDDWDMQGVRAMQTDTASIPWRELRDIVLSAPGRSEEARLALDLLRDWDGDVAADSAAATVFELFVAEMSQRVARAKAPGTWRWALGRGSSPVVSISLLAARRVGHLVRLLRDQPEGWFDTPWQEVVEEALAAAVARLQAERGNDQRRWAWGDVRSLTLRHPFGEGRVLGRVFNRGPFPWGGDANTVSQAAPDPTDPTSNPLVVASLRMVVDVGSWDDCLFSLPGGQSGNPVSRHYDDMLPLWLRGEGVPIAWSEAAIEKATTATLRLLPA